MSERKPLDLAAIRAWCEDSRLSPGPWKADDQRDCAEPEEGDSPGGWWIQGPNYASTSWGDGLQWTESDARFVVHAREDMPRLLAEVEALRERLDDWIRWFRVDGGGFGFCGFCKRTWSNGVAENHEGWCLVQSSQALLGEEGKRE